MIGWAPALTARMQRSASSPYIKNAGSNPPKSFHSPRSISNRQPVTMSTFLTVLRSQPPYATEFKTELFGARKAKPSDEHIRFQMASLRQHDAGFNDPSPYRVRPPQIPFEGYSCENDIRRSMAWSRIKVSGFSSRIRFPRACAIAKLLALAKPKFVVNAKSLTFGNLHRITSAEPSVDMLSTATIS